MLRLGVLISVLSLISVTHVGASGFDLAGSYGSRYLGLGGNQVALSGDAYSMFYNPAALTSINQLDIAANITPLITMYEAPVGAANAQEKSRTGINTLFYMGGAYRVNERVVVGLGMFPTSLSGADYGAANFGAGTLAARGLSSRLARIEIAPTVAFEIIDHISLGLSYRVSYTRFDKKGGAFGVLHVASTVSGWDFDGLKLGAFIDEIYGFNFAVTYRLPNTVVLRGETDMDFGAGTATAPAVSNASTKQDITLPSQIQMGLTYEWIKNKLLSAFTYEYTGGRVLETDSANVTGAAVAVATPIRYKNGHTFHLGTEYRFDMPTDQLFSLSAGVGHDRAFRRKSHPHPLLPPPSDYWGFSVGSRFGWGHHTVGAAFMYGFFRDKTVTAAEIDPALAGQVFAGRYGLTPLIGALDYEFKF